MVGEACVGTPETARHKPPNIWAVFQFGTVYTDALSSGFGIILKLKGVERPIPMRAYIESTASVFGRGANNAYEKFLAGREGGKKPKKKPRRTYIKN